MDGHVGKCMGILSDIVLRSAFVSFLIEISGNVYNDKGVSSMHNSTVPILGPDDARGWIACSVAEKGYIAVFKNGPVVWSRKDDM